MRNSPSLLPRLPPGRSEMSSAPNKKRKRGADNTDGSEGSGRTFTASSLPATQLGPVLGAWWCRAKQRRRAHSVGQSASPPCARLKTSASTFI
jgi:hypothetical protein